MIGSCSPLRASGLYMVSSCPGPTTGVNGSRLNFAP